jgi:hypothetical protein
MYIKSIPAAFPQFTYINLMFTIVVDHTVGPELIMSGYLIDSRPHESVRRDIKENT